MNEKTDWEGPQWKHPMLSDEGIKERYDHIRANSAWGRAAENPKEHAGRQKCPMHLLPPAAMRETANAMGLGATKYGRWNFRETRINASTYIGALYRHVSAWQDGEDIDPESGLSHIAHASACCAILLDSMARGTMNDDRSKVPNADVAAYP